MKKTALLFLAFLLLGSVAEAKVGKIKYGKYIIYEGEIENNEPKGSGNLVLTNIHSKDFAFISISGKFDGTAITDATFNATDFNALEFEGSLSFEPVGEKGKAMEIVFHLKDGTLYHDDIEYLYKRLRAIRVTDLLINVSTTKQTKEWAIGFGKDANRTAQFKAAIPDMPLPHNVDLLGFSTEKIKGFYADFNINEVLVNCTEQGRYVFNDDSYFLKDVMYFSNGDKVTFTNNDWVGSMTYADGTRISKDKDDNFSIEFANGDKYAGTLRRSTLQDLSRKGTDHPNFKLNTGVLTKGGKPEKWIAGESFSQRHARLLEVMREDLIAAVEDETMTEQEALKREKELKAEEERYLAMMAARRLEFADDSLSVVNGRYPAILSAVKGRKFAGTVSKSDGEGSRFAKKVQLSMNVSFVSATRCILNFSGKAIAKDQATAEYLASLKEEFVADGNFAYRIEGGEIYLYDTMDFDRYRLSFKYAKGIVTCKQMSGQLRRK